MFGKWPTRIFVSPETDPAPTTSRIDNRRTDTIMTRLSILLDNGRNNNRRRERQSGCDLSQGARDQYSGVATISVQIRRKTRINKYVIVIVRRRCVHEMQNPITRPERQANMRCRIQTSIVRHDPNDVAAL